MRAFVTGAGKGIGRAIALQLARDGYDLGLHVNASGLAGLALRDEIAEMGQRSVVAPADFSDLAAARHPGQAVREVRPVRCHQRSLPPSLTGSANPMASGCGLRP